MRQSEEIKSVVRRGISAYEYSSEEYSAGVVGAAASMKEGVWMREWGMAEDECPFCPRWRTPVQGPRGQNSPMIMRNTTIYHPAEVLTLKRPPASLRNVHANNTCTLGD